jgi:hypothetical protein
VSPSPSPQISRSSLFHLPNGLAPRTFKQQSSTLTSIRHFYNDSQ